MNDRIVLHAVTRRGGGGEGSSDVLTISPALVCERETDAGPLGLSPGGDGRSVVFEARLWTSPVPLSKESWIEPDNGPLHRWEKLTVQRVQLLGGLVFLRCSEKEVAGG